MKNAILVLFIFMSASLLAQDKYLLIGTYTNAGSKGIYVYRFNTLTGKVIWVSNTEGLVNPSFLTVAPDGKYVYAVTETAKENAGSLSSFSFDQKNGKLTFINKQKSGGDNPCYITVHENGKWVVVGNYSGGNLSAFQLRPDGGIDSLSQTIQHSGSSINKKRQEQAHVHATVFSPDYKYLFTPDLGTDKVMIYKFNKDSDEPLTPSAPPFAESLPGNGPRHFTFHPNKRFAYLLEEMSGTVVCYKYKNGSLKFAQRIFSHPAGFKGSISSADIHVSPDGNFLYASNRGDANSIAIFSINKKKGHLKLIDHQSTLGKTPRNFVIDPTGNYLLAANQATNNIVIFKRDKITGLLSPTGEEIKVPTPVCLKIVDN